ncbi:MAG: hypothetical protein ACREYE_28465 [Gammaproteobacteria bacterium]
MLAHRHPQRRLGTALAAVLALQLAACAGTQEKLYISSTTVLKLDASVNTARTAGHIQFSYDRYFVTWVPQSVKQDGGALEVMSALNCTEVTVGDLTLKKFEESLATGVAATKFARQLKDASGNPWFECFTKHK